ncbi:hypothetical protein PAEPH01_1456 [Pancytospora epiphaga]|nr:hypothetical protein PAEPH01_1456 [Pancytospora epiphaga]
MIVIFSLLIPVVLGLLSVKELEKSATEDVFEINDGVYIKPHGPLDLLYGFLSKERKQMDKKRMYSPGLKAHYSLTKKDNEVCFSRRGSRDVIHKFDECNSPISEYLTEYYRALKTMYSVANGEANIFTSQNKSLYMLLDKNTNKNNVNFKILAAMLLLTEGVDVPLEIQSKKYDYVVKGKKKSKAIPVLRYEGGENSPIGTISVELSATMGIEEEGEETVECTEKPVEELNDVKAMLKFFINYGGKNVKKLNDYELSEDDTPSFLIRSYIFEFLRSLDDARLFFKTVNDMLISTKNAKGSETWKMFFTTDKEEVSKYNPVRKACNVIRNIIAKFRFPFSIRSPPSSYIVVKAYDRTNDEFINNMTFSDCCDIAIYNLFCCLFYDPTTNTYSLDKLKKNGYEPTKELRNFYEDICKAPGADTPSDFHQEWTCVIQDLVLSEREKELLGNGKSDNNIIRYCKTRKIDGRTIRAELDADLLNLLKVIAKVTGMPEMKMMELGKICEMVKNGIKGVNNIQNAIEEFITKIFNEMSVMNIELDIFDIKILLTGDFKGVYGSQTYIKFKRFEGGELPICEHVIQLYLSPYHGEVEIKRENSRIKKEDREELERLAKECKDMKAKLGDLMADRIREFINLEESEPISEELLEKVNQAKTEIEMYSVINKLLNTRRIATTNDKLFIIDTFAPYLHKITSGDGNLAVDEAVSESNDTLSQNPQGSSDKNTGLGKTIEKGEMKLNDPVIRLISNIIANVPLDDYATQFCFLQIFTVCNGNHKDLFPEIEIDVNVTPPFEFSDEYIEDHVYLYRFSNYDVPNILNRLFNKTRDKYKDAFFDTIAEKTETWFVIYYQMVRKCVKLKCGEVINVIKEDFRIRNGIIESGSTELLRLIRWFDIVLSGEYYEGLVEVCNSCERIFKKEDRKFLLMKRIRTINRRDIEWNKLSGAAVKKLCANEKHMCILIEISLYCVDLLGDIDELYELFIPQFSISLCNLFLDHILDIINDLKAYLNEMVIPDVICDEASKKKLENDLKACEISENYCLWYFIRKIMAFIKTCSPDEICSKSLKQESENDLKPCKSFVNYYLWSFIEKIRDFIKIYTAPNLDINEEIYAIEDKVDATRNIFFTDIYDLIKEKTELIDLQSKIISEGPITTAVAKNLEDIVGLDQRQVRTRKERNFSK